MLLEQELILQLHKCITVHRYYGGPTNKIFDVDISSGETVLLEPAYPITLGYW